jgi:hypothetical protein
MWSKELSRGKGKQLNGAGVAKRKAFAGQAPLNIKTKDDNDDKGMLSKCV